MAASDLNSVKPYPLFRRIKHPPNHLRRNGHGQFVEGQYRLLSPIPLLQQGEGPLLLRLGGNESREGRTCANGPGAGPPRTPASKG